MQDNVEKSRAFIRLSLVLWISTTLLGGILIVTNLKSSWTGSDLYTLMPIPLSAVWLLSIFLLFQGFLSKKATAEEEERLLLEKRKEKKALLSNEDVIFNTQHTLKNFLKFGPYAMSVLILTSISGSLFWFWSHSVRRLEVPVPGDPLKAAFLIVMISIICIFMGVFYIGQSREKGYRVLRPAGAWLVLTSIVGLLSTFATVTFQFGYDSWDPVLSKAVIILLVILAIEIVINAIIEFYRPRTIAEQRPVYESRLLALFTEPGGVMKNVADTLDYQFGFKVSKTWIYGFVEKSIIPLFIFWLISLWLLTCIAEVGTGELGILENFGQRVEGSLKPGFHPKLPWPFAKIERYPVDRIEEIVIGAHMKDEKGGNKALEVILWTQKHYKNVTNYVVATKLDNDDNPEENVSRKRVPVSFMAALVPIQYRVSDIIKFAYEHENAEKILKVMAEREVVNYLASADMIRTMSLGREDTVRDLKEKIQKKADDMGLGVKIVNVNLHDVHPPVEEVSLAFQEVVSAQEEKKSIILMAEVEGIKSKSKTDAKVKKIKIEAEAYRDTVKKISKSEKGRFLGQLKSYRAMPSMYILRTYLDFLENDCAEYRKYVMPPDWNREVYEINLQETSRLDLTGADLSDFTNDSKKEK